MPKHDYPGEFELMVLLAIVRLGDHAYGVPISKELMLTTGREATLGSVYAALDRLERKGLVSSKLADPTPARGGRAKRYFQATPKGLKSAQTSKKAFTRLWSGIAQLGGKPA
jgi:PadR family transcriptional regulator, regulatory protein PadR